MCIIYKCCSPFYTILRVLSNQVRDYDYEHKGFSTLPWTRSLIWHSIDA